MLTRLEVHTEGNQPLLLPLSDISNGYIIEEIEGLDPVKATLVSTSFANMDGEEYHSSRREARDIVVKLELDTGNAQFTAGQLRSNLYRYLMPKSEVTLRFVMDDGLEVDIRGVVEDLVSPRFTKEPKVEIPIRCFNPDFFDRNVVRISGSTNSGNTFTPITYKGTVETGILFQLKVDRLLNDFTIYHRPANGTLRTLEFTGALQAGDVLKIETHPGSKAVTLLRAGSSSSMLYGMSPSSNWIELSRGVNNIQIYAEGLPIPYTIDYTTKYGGL